MEVLIPRIERKMTGYTLLSLFLQEGIIHHQSLEGVYGNGVTISSQGLDLVVGNHRKHIRSFGSLQWDDAV